MAEPTEDPTATDDGARPSTGAATGAQPAGDGLLARLERRLAPKPAPTPKNGVPTKWSVDRLDGRERLYCYGASVVAVVFTLLVYVGETTAKHFHPVKNQFSPTTALLVGLGLAVLLAVTTWIGRRALVGFVALFAFLGFENSTIALGLPFLILAGWLLYRSYRVQKEAAQRLRDERAASGQDPGPRTRREAVASGKAAAVERKKGPAAPEGNKRYTPKKPAPKPVPPAKPSWRERRAAKAAGTAD